MRSLVWFRNDLRTSDNPALASAAAQGEVEAVFVFSAGQWRAHDVGDRRFSWVLRTLHALNEKLAGLGMPLHVLEVDRFRDVPAALVRLAKDRDADRVSFNAEYPLNEHRRDTAASAALQAAGVAVDVHHGSVVRQPGTVLTGDGRPYTVFTPFKKRWLSTLASADLSTHAAPEAQAAGVRAAKLPEVVDGVKADFDEHDFAAGEDAAHQRLQQFVSRHLLSYEARRDFPALPGTSGISADLAVGALSPRQCLQLAAKSEPLHDSTWASELIWREFYKHVIAAFPHVSRGEPFKRDYAALRWEDDEAGFAAWREGRTGYPLVDAGMRQLNATGWMHNRLRMVTAMFLTKHLLIDWRKGEQYFMRQLIDGDFAANNGGWQWSASTGTDAAPYFRVFNPATQGKRFDAGGAFTRAWVPELADVPDKYLFEPWKVGADLSYPAPVVEHDMARKRAIERFKAL